MVLTAPGASLQLQERQDEHPAPAMDVTCVVCRTDLHVTDGELPNINYKNVPGHKVVGRVENARPGCDPRSRSESGSAFPGSDTLAADALKKERPGEPLRPPVISTG